LQQISETPGTSGKTALKSRFGLLFSLFLVFLKIGAFTWGGGYCMLPLIKAEVVDKRKWMKADAFLDGLAVTQSIPGALAINSAAFVGDRIAGISGALAAALGAVLPSYFVLILVTAFFLQFREYAIVQNFFKGATPAIVALLVTAVIDMGKEALKRYIDIIVAVGLFILLVFVGLHPIMVIVIAGILGLFTGRLR
jgi:chromate transporter